MRTLKLDPQPMWDSLDSLRPECLIQLGVNPHVGCSHSLLGEVDDRLDGPWGALLERTAVHEFVQMDSVFAGDDVLERRTGLTASLYKLLDEYGSSYGPSFEIKNLFWSVRGGLLYI